MRGFQHLLSRDAKLPSCCGAPLSSIRLFCNTPALRARAATAYNVSQTVLDIDAANNEHVKQVSIRRTATEDIPRIRRIADKSTGEPVDLFSEKGAIWLNNNANQDTGNHYRETLVEPGGYTQSKKFSNLINKAVAYLDGKGIPLSPGFTALGFRQASIFPNGRNKWYLLQVGRFFEEARKENYSFELARIQPGKFELSLVAKVHGEERRWLVSRHLEAIRQLICLPPDGRTISKELEQELNRSLPGCVRDLVVSKEQYIKYLNMVTAMRRFMKSAFRDEWLKENENGYLAQPPFEAAVQLVSLFAMESPATAAQVIEKWVAGEKSSVAEFKRRFNDEFEDYIVFGSGEEQEHQVFYEKAKINTMIDEVETEAPPSKLDETGSDSALTKGAHTRYEGWEEDVRQKIAAAAKECYKTAQAATSPANGLKIRRYKIFNGDKLSTREALALRSRGMVPKRQPEADNDALKVKTYSGDRAV